MEEGTWYCVLDGRTGRRKNMLAAASQLPTEPGCDNCLQRRSTAEIPPINSSLLPAYSVTVRLNFSSEAMQFMTRLEKNIALFSFKDRFIHAMNFFARYLYHIGYLLYVSKTSPLCCFFRA